MLIQAAGSQALALTVGCTLHAVCAPPGQAVRKMRDGWRQPHPQQPFGGPGGYRQLRGSGLKWTTGGSRGWLPRQATRLSVAPEGGGYKERPDSRGEAADCWTVKVWASRFSHEGGVS